MRKCIAVPMMTLCLLLCGCGTEKETTGEDLRQAYLDAPGCTMTATVSCDQEGRSWEGALRCDYVPGGDSTVEVLSPELIAGVKAIVGEDLSLSYEGEVLNIAPLTGEDLSPATCLPQLMDALRSGWLLEENRETWGETECVRLMMDQSGKDQKIISTLWQRLRAGSPVHGELAVEEEVIFTVEFTEFTFCDIIDAEESSSGK